LAHAENMPAPDLARTSEGKAAEVERLIAPSLRAMGYEIVRVILTGNRRARLQLMAERQDGRPMIVDDCVAISRAAEALLEVEDPISGSYELEVSSPGIDRPLTRLKDYTRFAGHDARIQTALPLDGRRRWRGRLLGVDGDRVRLETDEGEVAVSFADIAKAKLILTDALLAETPLAVEANRGID